MNNDSSSAAKSTEVEIKTPEVNVEYANVSSEEDSQKEKVTRMWSFFSGEWERISWESSPYVLSVILCYQKTKKKKEKKAKKEKKSKKDKKLLRADYEEAEGITTPSKEQVPPSQAETPVAVQLPVSFRIFTEFIRIKILCILNMNCLNYKCTYTSAF